jgi:acyl carrier protein
MNSDLNTLFAETFGISHEQLRPEATLESLGLDSLAVIEFLFQVEDKFNIRIPDQPNPPQTLGEVMQLIAPLLPASTMASLAQDDAFLKTA